MYAFVLLMLSFSIVLLQIYFHYGKPRITEFIYMINKNNEIIMDYSCLDMINSEICNEIHVLLNCNTRLC